MSGRLSIGRQSAWGVLLLLLALIPGIFIGLAVQHGLRELRALHTLDADAAGARVVHGTLVSASRLFVGELGATEGTGKGAHYVTYCRLRGLDGAMIRDVRGKTFTLSGFDGTAVRGWTLAIDGSGPAMFDMGSDRSLTVSPGAEILTKCDREAKIGLSYHEDYATTGAEVTVRGCPVGDRIAPCNDGLDFISGRSLDAMRADMKYFHQAGELVGVIPLAILCGFLALLARNKRVIDSREESR